MLVAAVDDGDPGWAPLQHACRLHGVLLVREPAAMPGRMVTLVGGGPGPADLITARGLEALREADVVYYDALGPQQDLDLLAPGAQLIDVGKTPGHHRVSQSEIERLMVASARLGNRVVRLKGGDPFVFGRGGEEVAACVSAGIPVTVIPGISSCYFGAGSGRNPRHAPQRQPPVHRGLRTCTADRAGAPSPGRPGRDHCGPDGHRHPAATRLPDCSPAGMRPDLPVAVVERGYRLDQRTTIAQLGSIVTAAANCSSPAVLVIGEVVAMGQPPRRADRDRPR